MPCPARLNASVRRSQLDTNAVDICVSWFRSHELDLNNNDIKVEYRGEANGTASIWLHSPRHTIDVCVWNHAFCLDILIFENSKFDLIFSEAGSCENAPGIIQRIERVMKWYESHCTSA